MRSMETYLQRLPHISRRDLGRTRLLRMDRRVVHQAKSRIGQPVFFAEFAARCEQ